MNIINIISNLLTLDILKLIVIIQSLVILYHFVKKRNIKMNIEGFAETIDAEALANLASLYQSGDFKVSNLTVTDKLTVGGDATITGNTKVGGVANITGDTNVGGIANITGNATIGGVANITGNTTIGGSANITGNATIGPAYIGHFAGSSEYAEFSHKSRKGGGTYSYLSRNNGETIVNTKNNLTGALRVNNASILRWDKSGVNIDKKGGNVVRYNDKIAHWSEAQGVYNGSGGGSWYSKNFKSLTSNDEKNRSRYQIRKHPQQ